MKKSALLLILMLCSLGVFAQTTNEFSLFLGGNMLRAGYFPEDYFGSGDLASQYEPYFKDISVAPLFGLSYTRDIGSRLAAGVSVSFGAASGVCVDPETNKSLYTKDVKSIYVTPHIRYYYKKGHVGAMYLGSNLLLGSERMASGDEGNVYRSICALSAIPYGFKINLKEHISLIMEMDAGFDFINTKVFLGIRAGVCFNF